jgi:hypothetical protein
MSLQEAALLLMEIMDSPGSLAIVMIWVITPKVKVVKAEI